MPQERYYSWKPEHPSRGTFSIIVTCLSTLGFCVWSAIYLSIPRKKPTWAEYLFTKLSWVAIGLVLPELLIIVALGQRIAAGRLRDKANTCLQFRCKSSRKRWYHLKSRPTQPNISYDTDDSSDDEEDGLDKEKQLAVKRTHLWTLTHGFYAKMGAFAFEEPNRFGKIPRRFVLSHANIEYLFENSPHLIPDVSVDDIHDKSKTDGLAKTLLFLQATWFCVNTLNRLVQDLPLSLMEVTTLAHASCSLTAYALWWSKPLDLQSATIIPLPDEETRKALKKGRAEGVVAKEMTHNSDDLGSFGVFFSAIGLSLIYGAPHLLAWNADFPTSIERLLWRISALIVMCSGLVVIAIAGLLMLVEDWWGKSVTEGLFMGLACAAYGASSLYLIAESFRQLFHLPERVFGVPLWSNYFPHFS